MLRKTVSALAVLTLTTGAQAASEVITFDGLGGGANNNNSGLILNADPGGAALGVGGFDWTSTTAGNVQLLDETRATGNKALSIASFMGAAGEPLGQWVGYLNSTSNVSFAAKTAGAAFNFDGASFWAKAATTLTITGVLAAGGVVTDTVSLAAQSLNNYVVASSKFDGVTMITFSSANTVFDNISVSAVPEPATYAMLLAGLGMMAAVARRRSRA